MARFEIYTKQLLQAGCGHPIWRPDPCKESAVEIADVGYLENGKWVTLFNGSKEHDDESNELGVPDGYYPLQVGKIQADSLSLRRPITSKSVSHWQLRAKTSLSAGVPVQADVGFSFKCSKEQGAVLILGDDVDVQDALHKRAFARYVRENSAAWLAFANRVHERGIALNDLVLVTGCHKTSAWACAAFSGSSTERGFNFHVGQAAVAQGGMSIWGSWVNCQSIDAHAGPPTPVPHPVPPVESPKCVDDGLESSNHESHGTTTEDATVGRSPIIHFYVFLALVLHRTFHHVFTFILARGKYDAIRGSQSHPIGGLPEQVAINVKEGGPCPRQRSNQGVQYDGPEWDRGNREVSTKASGNASDLSAPPLRNQCVFLRGYKMCDRKTWLARCRMKKRPYDGFVHLSREDDKDDPGSGPSTPQDHPPGPSGDPGGSQQHYLGGGGSSGKGASGSEPSGQRENGSRSSGSSETDSLDSEPIDPEIDETLDLCMQLNYDKEPTLLDIILQYILANCTAKLALVHDDDLTALLQGNNSVNNFEGWIHKVAPTIFVDQNQVGMLEITYRVFLSDTTDVTCAASVEAKSCATTLRLDDNDVSGQSNIHDDVGSALAQHHGDFIAIGRPVVTPAAPLYVDQVSWTAGPLFEANVHDLPLAQVGLVELPRSHKSNTQATFSPTHHSPLNLLQAPYEVLENVAYWAALMPGALNPPSALLGIFLISRSVHDSLLGAIAHGLPANNALLARIFKSQFDTAAVQRRIGTITNDILAGELKKRRCALRRISSGAFYVDHILEDLWLVYLMLLEDDGKNMSQLEYVGVGQWVKDILISSAEQIDEDGWPVESELVQLTAAIVSIVCDRACITCESLQVRQELLSLLHPFLVATHRYPITHLPDTRYRICSHHPLPSANDKTHITMASSTVYTPTIVTHFGHTLTLSAPLVADGAICAIFMQNERDLWYRCSISQGRDDADIQWRWAMQADWEESDLLHSQGPGVEVRRVGGEQENLALLENPKMASKRWDVDFWRMVYALRGLYPDPTTDLHLTQSWFSTVYQPGMYTGTWVGGYIVPDMHGFSRMLAMHPSPLSDVFVMPGDDQLAQCYKPMQMNLREHIATDVLQHVAPGEAALGDGVQNGWFSPELNLNKGWGLRETGDELVVRDSPEAVEGWAVKRYKTWYPGMELPTAKPPLQFPRVTSPPAEFDAIPFSSRFMPGVDRVEHDSLGRDDERMDEAADVDVIVTGETDCALNKAWGMFRFYGRVRKNDGLVVFVRAPQDPKSVFGRWVFRGYIRAGNTLVGRWRETGTDINAVPYEGSFVLCKVGET